MRSSSDDTIADVTVFESSSSSDSTFIRSGGRLSDFVLSFRRGCLLHCKEFLSSLFAYVDDVCGNTSRCFFFFVIGEKTDEEIALELIHDDATSPISLCNRYQLW